MLAKDVVHLLQVKILDIDVMHYTGDDRVRADFWKPHEGARATVQLETQAQVNWLRVYERVSLRLSSRTYVHPNDIEGRCAKAAWLEPWVDSPAQKIERIERAIQVPACKCDFSGLKWMAGCKCGAMEAERKAKGIKKVEFFR